jgi:Spy/CpxP family protein refolding chaperone
MGVHSTTRAITGILALVLGGALVCTQTRAQQGPANNPPPSPAQAGQPGPGEPGAPPPAQRRGMRVWVARGPGAGWAAWSDRDDQGLGARLGIGNVGSGGRGLNGPLEQAQRALHDPMIRQQLGISDDQAKTLESQVADFQKKVIQDQANLDIQRVDLENLLTSENPDRSAVDSKLEQVNSARLALQKSAVDFYLTVKQEITPEQQQKIRQFLQQRRQRFGAERPPRPGDRNPRRPGRSMYQGAQPPNGSSAYQENEPPQYGQQWQNAQGEPEQSPAPQPYNTGEPQGSTPMTNNQ